MAYTPVGWQTGDTITADRLNKMDRGWGYEDAELFSETVTTAGQSGIYSAQLDYYGTIDADSIMVTFDGTEYTCPRIDAFGQYFYGGFSEQGPVFTEYPFAIASNANTNTVYTETAGTYVVAVNGPSIVASDDFAIAVNSCIDAQDFPYLLVSVMDASTDQAWDDIYEAFASGYFCVVSGYGPVLQMWYGNGDRYYMATGSTNPQNGKFDPAIWRTPGTTSDHSMSFFMYNSQM